MNEEGGRRNDEVIQQQGYKLALVVANTSKVSSTLGYWLLVAYGTPNSHHSCDDDADARGYEKARHLVGSASTRHAGAVDDVECHQSSHPALFQRLD
jgi:hypothetical protein